MMKTARRLWPLEGPTMTVDAVTLMYGLTGRLTIPVPSFLVEHEKGLVLFDTGIDPDAITDPVGVFGQEVADVIALEGREEHRIDRQLEAIGFRTSDVTHVVSSHLHFDHCGGHHLFRGATFYAGAGELAFARTPDPISAPAFPPPLIEGLRGLDWRETAEDLDLFGDGSITLLTTPGHTPGQISLLVRLSSRTFILTGDAVHLRVALDLEYPFPLDHDTKSSLATLRRLKRLRESTGASVWISHDPDDWSEYGRAGHGYE